MRMRSRVRVAWAISLLVCLLAILLMPGMTTVLVVRSHATGKHMVRLVNAHSQMTLSASSVYRNVLRPPAVVSSSSRQVVHGPGPAMLEKTCVLRC